MDRQTGAPCARLAVRRIVMLRLPHRERPHLPLVVRAVRLAISLMAGTACAGFRIALRRGGMDAASRAGGGVRQAWRRRNERDHTCVAANDTQRAVAFSLQLRRAHQQLRDELAQIREALGADEHRLTGCRSTAWRSAQPWPRITWAKTTACRTRRQRRPRPRRTRHRMVAGRVQAKAVTAPVGLL